MKKLWLCGLYLLLFLVAPHPVQAISEFTTNFKSTYTISSIGETEVEHVISLKNNLSHIYATSYTIATSGDDLKHISASDQSGPISSTTNIQNGITTITMAIDHPAIGKDQEKIIKLNYATSDVVEKIGNTLTINIPRLAKANEAESYTRIVKIEDLGNSTGIIYPKENKVETVDRYQVYTFEGHQNDSLSLLFGDSVSYKLNLTYELKNKELSAVDSELALPPDTGYQRILLNSIDPPPKDVRLDENGNWLARYELKPQEKILIKAELFATIYPIPTLYDPSPIVFQKTPHSKYWETSAESVTNLAEQLKTPDNFYKYLTTNFTYNYGGIDSTTKRMGAVASLASPSGVLCTEFTDTFIALARSKDIPSREINGFGFTKSSTLKPQNVQTDILHAWPEFYDKTHQTWISVDPTWGNTTGGIDYFSKLDFSHIAFVRHGSEDSYPLPPGAYKTNPQDKFVEVAVADQVPPATLTYDVKSDGKNTKIINTGNTALIDKTISVQGSSVNIPYLPPYASFDVIPTSPHSLWTKVSRLFQKLATWVGTLVR